eukprot:g52063.t1
MRTQVLAHPEESQKACRGLMTKGKISPWLYWALLIAAIAWLPFLLPSLGVELGSLLRCPYLPRRNITSDNSGGLS